MIRIIKNLKNTRMVTRDVLHRILNNQGDSCADYIYFLYPSKQQPSKYDLLWVAAGLTAYDGIITMGSNVEFHRRNRISAYNLKDLIIVTYTDIKDIHERGKYVDISKMSRILDEFYSYGSNSLYLK